MKSASADGGVAGAALGRRGRRARCARGRADTWGRRRSVAAEAHSGRGAFSSYCSTCRRTNHGPHTRLKNLVSPVTPQSCTFSGNVLSFESPE